MDEGDEGRPTVDRGGDDEACAAQGLSDAGGRGGVGPVAVGGLVDVTNYQVGFAVGGALLLLGSFTASLIPQKLDRSFLKPPVPEDGSD